MILSPYDLGFFSPAKSTNCLPETLLSWFCIETVRLASEDRNLCLKRSFTQWYSYFDNLYSLISVRLPIGMSLATAVVLTLIWCSWWLQLFNLPLSMSERSKNINASKLPWKHYSAYIPKITNIYYILILIIYRSKHDPSLFLQHAVVYLNKGCIGRPPDFYGIPGRK